MLGERMFNVGEIHTTHGGQLVKIVAYSNESNSYETALGSDGKHRYNRRDYGRCTSTDWELPSEHNLEIPKDRRSMVTYMPAIGSYSMNRAERCSCGSDRVINARDPFGDVIIRCLRCGNKSKSDSNTSNAVNHWNKGVYDET